MTPAGKQAAIEHSLVREDVALWTLDTPNKSANVITQGMLDELEEQIGQAEHWDDLKGLVIVSAKPRIFVAGADLAWIRDHLSIPPADIEQFCHRGQRLLDRIARFPFVTVAAIGGVCVGGGLELALACDWRILTSDEGAFVGLPEVKLGLIPGWAGSVRLPRLIDWERAAQLIVSGRSVKPTEALALGIVDELGPRERLVEMAVAAVDRLADSGDHLARRKQLRGPVRAAGADIDAAAKALRVAITEKASVDPHAPLVELEHLVATATLDADTAALHEATAMTRVWGNPANAALLHSFFLDDYIKKNPGEPSRHVEPLKIEHIAVIGVGQMGSQIATCAAQHGYDVFVRDADEQKAQRLAESFSPEAGGARGGRIHAVTQPTQLRRCHLVIECAVESLSVKRDLLSEVEPLLGKDALIVTNTSSLPVDQLARSLNIPSRFGGLHFCDPIDRRPLVEIGQGRETSDRTVASLIAFVRALGKLPLVVRGEIGLVVNRIIGPLLDEGVRLVDAGMAPEVIDEAARRFGYLQGPLEMIDSFGLDTIFSAAQSMMEHRPGTVTPNAVLQRLIEKGRLGRKSGAGFYRWDGAMSPQVDPALDQLLKRRLDHRTPPDTDTIVRNLNLAMLDQAIATIDEHVVRDARDVDYCSIHGCGFPVSRGGIMFWAQQVGRQKLTERARQLAHERAGFRLADRLAEADGLT